MAVNTELIKIDLVEKDTWDAILESAGGGGGEKVVVYVDTAGTHGGDGYDTTPYPLYSDAALTHALTKAEIEELIVGGNFMITDPINTQWNVNYMYPVTAFVSPANSESSFAVVVSYIWGEGITPVYMGYYAS